MAITDGVLKRLQTGDFTPGANLDGKSLGDAVYDQATNRYYKPTYSTTSDSAGAEGEQVRTLVGYIGFHNSPDAVGKTNYVYDLDGNQTSTFQTEDFNKSDWVEKVAMAAILAMTGAAAYGAISGAGAVGGATTAPVTGGSAIGTDLGMLSSSTGGLTTGGLTGTGLQAVPGTGLNLVASSAGGGAGGGLSVLPGAGLNLAATTGGYGLTAGTAGAVGAGGLMTSGIGGNLGTAAAAVNTGITSTIGAGGYGAVADAAIAGIPQTAFKAAADAGIGSSLMKTITDFTGLTAAQVGQIASTGLGLFGNYVSGNAAKDAAQTSANAQIEAAKIAADAARFRPVGVTSRFGQSKFGFDDKGNLNSAGYTLAPDIRAQQDRLMNLAGGQAPGMMQTAAAGRNGDTQLAHVNPQEAALLKSLGGSGTINPRTGLREFYTPIQPAIQTPSDAEIKAFVEANINNPQAIADAAAANGVSFADISRATGYSTQEVTSYLAQTTTAPAPAPVYATARPAEVQTGMVEGFNPTTGQGYGTGTANTGVLTQQAAADAVISARLAAPGRPRSGADFGGHGWIPNPNPGDPNRLTMDYIPAFIRDPSYLAQVPSEVASMAGPAGAYNTLPMPAPETGAKLTATNADINAWLNANPTASDQRIRQQMDAYGVTPQQLAEATGKDVGSIISRYNAAGQTATTTGATTTGATTTGATTTGATTTGQRAATEAEKSQFTRMVNSGDYNGAVAYARGLGFSDADISSYIGQTGTRDIQGNVISRATANSFLTNREQYRIPDGGLLGQFEASQAATAPMGQAALSMMNLGNKYINTNPTYTQAASDAQYQKSITDTARYGTAATNMANLGDQYLGTSPQAQAQKYMQEQQALLGAGRERSLATLQNSLQQQGRLGLATGGTTTGMGAANPEMEAFYNAQRQQDLGLAAQATQGGMDYAKFGTGMLGSSADMQARQYGNQSAMMNPFNQQQQNEMGLTTYGAGLVGAGGQMQRDMYGTQSAAFGPYQTAMGGAAMLEGLGQNTLDTGINIGSKGTASGANAGQLLQTGYGGAARTMQPANSYSPWGGLLTGAGQALQQYAQPNRQPMFDAFTGRPL